MQFLASMPTPRNPFQVKLDGINGAAPVGSRPAHLRQQGIYAQDQISAGGLRVILSGRQDWARQAADGLVNKNKKFTYRAGARCRFPRSATVR